MEEIGEEEWIVIRDILSRNPYELVFRLYDVDEFDRNVGLRVIKEVIDGGSYMFYSVDRRDVDLDYVIDDINYIMEYWRVKSDEFGRRMFYILGRYFNSCYEFGDVDELMMIEFGIWVVVKNRRRVTL